MTPDHTPDPEFTPCFHRTVLSSNGRGSLSDRTRAPSTFFPAIRGTAITVAMNRGAMR